MSKTSTIQEPTGNRIYDFFEFPRTFVAKLVQFIIFILIIASVALVVIEFFYTEIFEQYRQLLTIINYIVLAVFTVEYVLRISTSPNKSKFFIKPFNVIDFLAVFPNYLEILLPLALNTTGLRGLRLLRLARALRGLRLFKYGRLFKRVFRYQQTILQAITQVLVLFAGLKIVIWVLEYYGFWFSNSNLGELFAIIGFALGIILSQKIGASYDKFIQVEEAATRIYGTLHSLSLILMKVKPGTEEICKNWSKEFVRILEDPKAKNYELHQSNEELYNVISTMEKDPAELAILHGDIVRDAAFCLSKKIRLTPKAYDTLLNQSTMLYLGLIAVFIPGVIGLLSVLVTTYILYGMYNITQDFDSIIGGEFDLINIDISELKYFANSK